jgi:hypothetical protein
MNILDPIFYHTFYDFRQWTPQAASCIATGWSSKEFMEYTPKNKEQPKDHNT